MDEVPVPLLRNRNFRLLWVGQTVSSLGSNVSVIAYPLLVLELTQSPVAAGLIGTLGVAVSTLGRLPGGAVADRMDRRSLMIGCDVVRAGAVGLLALLVAVGAASWPVVLVVVLVNAVGEVLFSPAQFAALPAVVPREQLAAANAANEARQFGASLAGLPLGGALFGLAATAPFVANALAYDASLGTIAGLRGRFQPVPQPRRSLHREIGEGLAYTWRTPLLRAVVLQAPLINLATIGVIYTVTLVLATDGTSATVIGAVQALLAAGGLLGAVLAPQIQKRLRLSTLVIMSSCTSAALIALSAVLAPSVLLGMPLAGVYLLFPAANASLFASVMQATPEHLQGRVSSTIILAAGSLAALAPAMAGLLVAHTTPQWAIGAFAIAMAAGAGIAVTSPALRQAEAP